MDEFVAIYIFLHSKVAFTEAADDDLAEGFKNTYHPTRQVILD